MATEGLTYTQYVNSLKSSKAAQYMLDLESAVNNGQISQYEFSRAVESVTGKAVRPYRAYNGDILGYTLETIETSTASNPINSNASTVSRGTIARPISSTVNQGGKAVIQGLRGVGTKVATGAALVGTAAACVSAGITLGKTIDSSLYNFNPDFWNSIGLSTLNPETWNSITSGDDSMGAKLLNYLFGFDDDGNAQAYMDANAFSYLAYCLNNGGVFNNGSGTSDMIDNDVDGITINPPISFIGLESTIRVQNHVMPSSYMNVYTTPIGIAPEGNVYLALNDNNFSNVDSKVVIIHSNVGLGVGLTLKSSTKPSFGIGYIDSSTGYYRGKIGSNASNNVRVKNKYINFTEIPPSGNIEFYNPSAYPTQPAGRTIHEIVYATIYGDYETHSAIPGIGNQTGATLPNFDGLSESDYLSYLEQTYPDLFNNAINYPVLQDDGNVKNYTYVPVAFPNINNRTDTEPTSGSATQAYTEINPSTFPQELIDTLTQILTNPIPETKEQLDNYLPPENPTDTGDGSSPTPTVPVGSASALWKIYHPTQAQVDSFGGWLWSSNFIDQILKIFNNPMEAVIGLHKVYATPVDAGNTTIKVGYLDSQVPSAYIEQQYIEVDCGSVNLSEQFGNVFDYSPFTDVQLYLPFVGIVPLNVADVMRSTISITYGVDVITGACLAQVEVSRDNNSSILYQYSGNCAVQYPISSGSYMGIVSSIISVAGGVAATVASGGAAAPLALGAAGGLLNAHTNVQHSGGFSGNAGAMGGKKPYLIITRPQTKVASNSEMMYGSPTNSYTTIGECEGYIKAEKAHIINVSATDEELAKINELVLSGIIV